MFELFIQQYLIQQVEAVVRLDRLLLYHYLQPLLRRFLFVEANIKAFFKLGKFAYVFFSAPPHVWRMAYTRHEAGIRAFGQRLRQLRKEKGLSQEALAFAADIE